MKLLSPLKWGTSRTGWHHELKSLEDLFKCQTQGFGANPEMYARFGIEGHNGLDFALENGDPIYASHDGTASAQINDMAGKGVVITGKECKTIYWHLNDFVKPLWSGWEVKAGDLIGHGDNTGFSTGPHLHFGLKLLDSNGNVLNRDNGFDGAVDPTQYIVWGMTEQEVKDLYALAFYRLPDVGELSYWVGKELATFLKTAIKDRGNFLLNI
jgi:murein DD-endopeptidase MepM/ murein hydrolase activator NlpD